MLVATIGIIAIVYMVYQQSYINELKRKNKNDETMISFWEKRERAYNENQDNFLHIVWNENGKHVDYMWTLRNMLTANHIEYPPFPGDEPK